MTQKKTVPASKTSKSVKDAATMPKKSTTNEDNVKIIQVEQTVPKVEMRFRANVHPSNRIDYGTNGKYGTFYGNDYIVTVDKQAFVGDFRTPFVQAMLKKRMLIVLNGLTDEERRHYGVDYAAGEFLEDVVFDNLCENDETVLALYPRLCPLYKKMVAEKFCELYEQGKMTTSRAIIEKLNVLSREEYTNLSDENPLKKGAFWPILAAMNKKSEG